MKLTAKLFLVVLACWGGVASAQNWDYQSFNSSGPSNKVVFYLEKDGEKYFVGFRATNMNRCLHGQQPATVVESAEFLVISKKPIIFGCDELRYTIKKDGSGGKVEKLVNGVWEWDGLERGLTLAK